MLKKLTKSDYIFLFIILAFLLINILCMFTPMPYDDEALYPMTPIRFINGDTMLKHEWHMSQFAAIFSHLPILLWVTLKGSTQGIMLFLRVSYIIIHLLTTICIYKFFRNEKIWGIVASLLFVSQVPYRMQAISYMSMIIIFLLFFEFCIIRVHTTKKKIYSFLGGFFYACCCVCNPMCCLLFPIYLIVSLAYKIKYTNDQQKNIKSHKTKASKKTFLVYFEKNTILFFFFGISLMAIICILYYISTGGTLSSFFSNIENLFIASEYNIFTGVKTKLLNTVIQFNEISFKLSFIIPLFFTIILLDKNKYNRKLIYAFVSLAISVFYTVGISVSFISLNEQTFALSLPFNIFSITCYILTKNKNKQLFYSMWCPTLVFAIIQFLATNTYLTAPSAILTISNIAGVFFVRDLYREFNYKEKTRRSEEETRKLQKTICLCVICFSFCLQTIFNCFGFTYKRVPTNEYTKVTTGPFSQIYLDKSYYKIYTSALNDLDIIKSLTTDNEPVLIMSRMGWMHLYIDRPSAGYCAALFSDNSETLALYYKQNPEKKPKYIYVSYANAYYITSKEYAMSNVRELKKIFKLEQKELSMGYLLTVKE